MTIGTVLLVEIDDELDDVSQWVVILLYCVGLWIFIDKSQEKSEYVSKGGIDKSYRDRYEKKGPLKQAAWCYWLIIITEAP
jgi:hypothetical protein